MSVSRNRPSTGDRLPATIKPGDKVVGLARISYQDMFVSCSCGWTYGHVREKPRENAIDRHLNKRHQGRGIRL